MECRSEYTLAFKIALNKIRGLDIQYSEIELHGVERIENVLEQVFNTPKVIKQMDEIKRVSRENGTYNPLIAILAASWINKGEELKGLSKDKFLENFVEYLFFKEKTEEVQRIFTLLSVCKGIEKEDLKNCKSLWSLPTDDLNTKWKKIESIMESFLDGNSYMIKPDLISEVIFRNKALEFYGNYVDSLIEFEHGPAYCSEMAQKLGEAYQKDINCIEQAYILLEKVKETGSNILYFCCVSALLYNEMPIKPMKICIKMLVEGAEEFAVLKNLSISNIGPFKLEEVIRSLEDVVPRHFIITLLVYLAVNNIVWSEENGFDLEVFLSHVKQAAKILSDKYKRQCKKFSQEEFMIKFLNKLKDILKKEILENPSGVIFREEYKLIYNDANKIFWEVNKDGSYTNYT